MPSAAACKLLCRLVATTGFSLGYTCRDSFVKKAKIMNDGGNAGRILDIVFEQQVYQALNYLNNFVNIEHKELMVLRGDTLTDFFGRRRIYKDLTMLKDCTQMAHALFLSICYLADLHENKRLFHGDIKPQNLFVITQQNFSTSDSGSLEPLVDNDAITLTKGVYTKAFASDEYVAKVL